MASAAKVHPLPAGGLAGDGAAAPQDAADAARMRRAQKRASWDALTAGAAGAGDWTVHQRLDEALRPAAVSPRGPSSGTRAEAGNGDGDKGGKEEPGGQEAYLVAGKAAGMSWTPDPESLRAASNAGTRAQFARTALQVYAVALAGAAASLLVALAYSASVREWIREWDAAGVPPDARDPHALSWSGSASFYAWLILMCPAMCCWVKIFYVVTGMFGWRVTKPHLPVTVAILAGMASFQLLFGALEHELASQDSSYRPRRWVMITGTFLFVFAASLVLFGRVGRDVGFPTFRWLHFGEVAVSNSILWAYSLWVSALFFSVDTSASQAAVRVTLHPALNALASVLFRLVGRRVRKNEWNTSVLPFAHYAAQMAIWGRFLVTNVESLVAVAALSLVLSIEQVLHAMLELEVDRLIYIYVLRVPAPKAAAEITSGRSVRLHLDMISVRRLVDFGSIFVGATVTIIFQFAPGQSTFDATKTLSSCGVQLAVALGVTAATWAFFPRREAAAELAWASRTRGYSRHMVLFMAAQTAMFLFFFVPQLVEHSKL